LVEGEELLLAPLLEQQALLQELQGSLQVVCRLIPFQVLEELVLGVLMQWTCWWVRCAKDRSKVS
jgi:hypothetical protein